jgi:uncharacterized protein (TIGR02246 family)
MSRVLLAVIALSACASTSTQQPHTRKELAMTIDATAIATRLANHLETAWNAADGDSYGAVFTNDASFVDIRGDHHRSRIAIGKGHAAVFGSIYRGSKVRFEVTSASVVGNVVVAHAQIAMDAPAAPLPPNAGSIASFVVVDDGGTWRIAAYHNTLRLKRPAE